MDALAHLAALRIAWDQRSTFVRLARSQGATWEQITEAVGLSRQTVINLSHEKRLDS
ncbi:hypothetical protein [uncultured Microbacterium sp.]|uniref:hypothetical protein n=1 Tax=uncultured Microbacterium sp. TaxID=191216 RepID=UPI0025D0FDC5|nr:hypothetical protein [uncultured Microbacterium sp.]